MTYKEICNKYKLSEIPEISNQEQQGKVNMAIQTANNILNRKRSEKTIQQYMRTFYRLVNSEHNWQDYSKKNSKYHHKAAFQYGLANAIMLMYDKQKYDKVLQLYAMMPDLDYEKQNKYRISGTNKKYKKDSKRLSLPKDTNWQDKILDNVSDKYKLYAYVQAITGCRNQELNNGISIFVGKNNIVFQINGAKVTDYSGHSWRKLSFSLEEDRIKKLLKLINNKKRLYIKLDKIGAYRKHIKNIAKKIYGKATKISCYSFRHQFAADLKKEINDRKIVAAALGQRTDRTQQHYGVYQQGRSKTGLNEVSTEFEIKQKTKLFGTLKTTMN